MTKKTHKNLALRSGKLAWRVAVFGFTVAAVLAAKLLRLGLAASAEQGDDSAFDLMPIDTDYIVSPETAEAAVIEGKIGAAEYAYFVDPYGDGLGP